MTALKFLILEKNQFTGTIPATIGQLTLLTNLELNNNRLTGTIPSLSFFDVDDFCNLDSNCLTSSCHTPCTCSDQTSACAMIVTTLSPPATSNMTASVVTDAASSTMWVTTVRAPVGVPSVPSNTSALVGGVVGILLLLLVVAGVAFCVCRGRIAANKSSYAPPMPLGAEHAVIGAVVTASEHTRGAQNVPPSPCGATLSPSGLAVDARHEYSSTLDLPDTAPDAGYTEFVGAKELEEMNREAESTPGAQSL